jgi:glutamate-1-semialdehyde 2,1-aminomutase
LQAAVTAANGDVAAVIVSAFKHDLGKDQAAAEPLFAQQVRALCDSTGAALVLDDVRAGLRLDLRGSWESIGVRPDLSAWSKAIANGYPLSFVAGSGAFRDAARSVYATGSFWCASASMAAALATLEVLSASNAIAHLQRVGDRLRRGLAAQALSHGLGLRQTGPSQMPMLLFDDDAAFKKAFVFTQEALKHGVYLHPKHNMFLSLAHSESDIDTALIATEQALAAVARRFY